MALKGAVGCRVEGAGGSTTAIVVGADGDAGGPALVAGGFEDVEAGAAEGSLDAGQAGSDEAGADEAAAPGEEAAEVFGETDDLLGDDVADDDIEGIGGLRNQVGLYELDFVLDAIEASVGLCDGEDARVVVARHDVG